MLFKVFWLQINRKLFQITSSKTRKFIQVYKGDHIESNTKGQLGGKPTESGPLSPPPCLPHAPPSLNWVCPQPLAPRGHSCPPLHLSTNLFLSISMTDSLLSEHRSSHVSRVTNPLSTQFQMSRQENPSGPISVSVCVRWQRFWPGDGLHSKWHLPGVRALPQRGQ